MSQGDAHPTNAVSVEDNVNEAGNLELAEKTPNQSSSSVRGNPEYKHVAASAPKSSVMKTPTATQQRHGKTLAPLKSSQTAGLVKPTADIRETLQLFEKERARLDYDLNPATEYQTPSEVVESLRSYAKWIAAISLSLKPCLSDTCDKLKERRKDAIDEVLTEMLNQMSDLKTKMGLVRLVTWAETDAGQRNRQLVYRNMLGSYSSELTVIATQIKESKSVVDKPLGKLAKMARLGRAFAAKKAFVNALGKLKEDSTFKKEYEKARRKDYRNNEKHQFKLRKPLLTKRPVSLHHLIRLVQKL